MRYQVHVTKLVQKKTPTGYDFITEDGRLAGRAELSVVASKRFWAVLTFTNGQSTEPTHPKGGASSLTKAAAMILRDHVTQARLAPAQSVDSISSY